MHVTFNETSVEKTKKNVPKHQPKEKLLYINQSLKSIVSYAVVK